MRRRHCIIIVLCGIWVANVPLAARERHLDCGRCRVRHVIAHIDATVTEVAARLPQLRNLWSHHRSWRRAQLVVQAHLVHVAVVLGAARPAVIPTRASAVVVTQLDSEGHPLLPQAMHNMALSTQRVKKPFSECASHWRMATRSDAGSCSDTWPGRIAAFMPVACTTLQAAAPLRCFHTPRNTGARHRQCHIHTSQVACRPSKKFKTGRAKSAGTRGVVFTTRRWPCDSCNYRNTSFVEGKWVLLQYDEAKSCRAELPALSERHTHFSGMAAHAHAANTV